MTAAILCPGPSLKALEVVPRVDLTIAVNRAALTFACDWWAARDYPMIRDNAAKVLAIRTTANDLRGRLNRFRVLATAEELNGWCPANLLGTLTALLALLFAAKEGATRIDVYGADWKGTQDYDGTEAGENRTDERWAKEAGLWQAACDWLSGRGVEVARHILVTT